MSGIAIILQVEMVTVPDGDGGTREVPNFELPGRVAITRVGDGTFQLTDGAVLQGTLGCSSRWEGQYKGSINLY